MNRDACFLLGKITKPHSFKGEVVLWMDVDDPEPYRNVETLWVEQHGTLVPYMLKSLKSHKDRFVAQLHDVTTEAQAKALAGKDIWLPLSELPPIDEGKFYFHEVQGWTLVDAATEEAVGTVMHVVKHAAYPCSRWISMATDRALSPCQNTSRWMSDAISWCSRWNCPRDCSMCTSSRMRTIGTATRLRIEHQLLGVIFSTERLGSV